MPPASVSTAVSDAEHHVLPQQQKDTKPTGLKSGSGRGWWDVVPSLAREERDLGPRPDVSRPT